MELRFAISRTVRTAPEPTPLGKPGRLVVLDLHRGDYHSLNGTAAAIWQDVAAGLAEREIAPRLAAAFGAPEVVASVDVRRILEQWTAAGWIVPLPDGVQPPPPPPVCGAATERHPAVLAATALPRPGGWRRRAVWALCTTDLRLHRGRFSDFLAGLPAPSPRSAGDPAIVGWITRAIDDAARLYVRRVQCLLRASTGVRLLRRYGFPAQLVLGVRTFPFAAHAWVELDGAAVDELPSTLRAYQVLDRW